MGNKQKDKRKIALVLLNVVSVALIIAGIVFGPKRNDGRVYVNLPVVLAGIVLCIAGNFGIVVATFVKLVIDAKAYNRYLEENNVDEREEEEAFKTYINNTAHNQEATAFRDVSMFLRANKNAPKEKGVRSYANLVLVILFLCCLPTFVVLLCAGQRNAGLVVLGAAFGIILVLLTIALVHKKISTNRKNIDRSCPPKTATVISSMISDESTFGSGRRYNLRTNRILSTTYLIYLDVDGETKKAYSKTYYNKGEKVCVYRNKKLKDVVIIKEE